MNSSSGIATSLLSCPGASEVRTDGGTSSMTCTLVSASCSRIDSVSRWIAAVGGVVAGRGGQRGEAEARRDGHQGGARLRPQLVDERGDQADRAEDVGGDDRFGRVEE